MTLLILPGGTFNCSTCVGKYIVGLLLSFTVQLAIADVCPLPSAEDALTSVKVATPSLSVPKSCPDFKDDVDQSACCPSQITPGTFYCCTSERQAELESQIAAEARRRFLKNYLAVIIISTVLSGVVLLVVVTILCKRLTFCPMYEAKSYPAQPLPHFPARYRPVETTVNKPPAIYEAPPPYDFTQAPSNERTQHQNDWNCLLENRANSMRQSDNNLSG
jgi:hypothetical protein